MSDDESDKNSEAGALPSGVYASAEEKQKQNAASLDSEAAKMLKRGVQGEDPLPGEPPRVRPFTGSASTRGRSPGEDPNAARFRSRSGQRGKNSSQPEPGKEFIDNEYARGMSRLRHKSKTTPSHSQEPRA